MKQVVLALACLSGAASAQDFAARAEAGEQVMTTAAGDAYLEAIGPALQAALQTCRQQGQRMKGGEIMTLVAQVSPDGAWSDVQMQSASPAAGCIAQHLQATKLPPPQWEWQRGAFPLTLRLGAGRGTVNGVPEEG